MYMVLLMISMNNFYFKYWGKVVGIFDVFFSGGLVLFFVLYGMVFVVGYIKDEENQNFGGFYFMIVIVFGVVGVFGIFLLKYVVFDIDIEVSKIINVDDGEEEEED